MKTRYGKKSRVGRTQAAGAPGGRGSVLVIVLVTLIFAAVALVAFVERASADLLVTSRDFEARRLRAEAYSALEVTLAVLEDFRRIGGGLHSVSEGWSDPIGFAGWTPSEGRTVEVTFEDESGKLSLPQANATQLTNLFKTWQLTPAGPDAPPGTSPPADLPFYDAEQLTDALIGWMKANHSYSTPVAIDYNRDALPFTEPGRSLRSFAELRDIDYVRDIFFTPDGRPNSLWQRFTSDVSLYRFPKPNLNSPKTDVLAALGQFDLTQTQKFADYLAGTGQYAQQGPAWFKSTNTARALVGRGGEPNAFATTISALRIVITVHDGASQFRLTAVVAPLQGGATSIVTNASEVKASSAEAAAAQSQASVKSAPATSAPSAVKKASADANNPANAKKLNYPFTLLEILENNEIPPAPPSSPPVPT